MAWHWPRSPADKSYDTQVTANLQRLAKVSGTVLTTDTDKYRREERTSFTLSIGEVYGTVQASNNTAQLELRCLTVAQAEHILQYLKTEHLALKNERTAKLEANMKNRLTKRAIRESRLEATRLMAMAQCGVEYGTDGYRMLQHAIWQILSDLHLEKL